MKKKLAKKNVDKTIDKSNFIQSCKFVLPKDICEHGTATTKNQTNELKQCNFCYENDRSIRIYLFIEMKQREKKLRIICHLHKSNGRWQLNHSIWFVRFISSYRESRKFHSWSSSFYNITHAVIISRNVLKTTDIWKEIRIIYRYCYCIFDYTCDDTRSPSDCAFFSLRIPRMWIIVLFQ